MKYIALIILVFTVCISIPAQAVTLTCAKVFSDKSLYDQAMDNYLGEFNSFSKDYARYRELQELSSRVEAWKNRRGSSVRKTRSERELKIHRMRMSIRTGDVYHVIEAIRNLFEKARGGARVLDRGRALLLVLEQANVKSKLGHEKYMEIRQSLIRAMDSAIDILGEVYGDYSAAEMVLGEMSRNGELAKKLSAEQMTLEEFQAKLKEPDNALSPELMNLYEKEIVLKNFHDTIIAQLPPNSLLSNLLPDIFNVAVVTNRAYVKSIFNGDLERYGNQMIYRQEGPLKRVLELDLKAEKRSFWLGIFTTVYGKMVDQFVNAVNLIPGGGFKLDKKAFKDLSYGEALINRISQLSATGRWGLYQFVKAFINRRAMVEHLSDIDTLHKMAELRGDEMLFMVTRDMAAKHGELNFFMTYSRVPFYHNNFLHFKSILIKKIKEADANGQISLSLNQSLKNLEEGEVRGAQLGTLNVLVKKGFVEEFIQSATLIVGSPVMFYELWQFFVTENSAGTTAVQALLGQ